MRRPAELYKKYGKASEAEIENYLILCRYKKDKFDYNRIYKLRYEIESAISFFVDLNQQEKHISMVYILWFMGGLNNKKKTLLAKTVSVFGKRNRRSYNTKFFLVPNHKKDITMNDLLNPAGKYFAFMRQKPRESVAKNLKIISKHYPNYNHFVIIFADKPPFIRELKMASMLSNDFLVFIVVNYENGVYLVKRNFFIKKVFSWNKRRRRSSQEIQEAQQSKN